MIQRKEIKKDDWAIVLDFLSHGMYGMKRAQPVAQVLGDKFFSLLEVIVREDITLKTDEKVYIGEKKREKIKYIRGRLLVKDLTAAARDELPAVIRGIIEKNPGRFLDFFNKGGQITTRLHQLELLPGIGKKHLWAIINERKISPFDSFKDLKTRVPLLPDPEKMIIKRIFEELEDKDKYRLFVPRFERRERYAGKRRYEPRR